MHTDVVRERETRPGSWVKALMDAKGLDEAHVAVITKRAPSTVYRWASSGIDYVAWVGLLTLVGVPATWKPGDVVPKLPDDWRPGDPVVAAEKPKKA